MTHKNGHVKEQGFTIVELMVATAVFSVVLILCSMGLLQVGRVYYKGVTTSRTQEAARTVLTEISQAIQFGAGPVYDLPNVGGSDGRCVGGVRFSYITGRQLVDNPSGGTQSRHVIVMDNIDCGPGTPAQSVLASPVGRELLSTRMRLVSLDVSKLYPLDPSSNLYRVSVRVVSGDDDVLDGTLSNCKGNLREGAGGQFCAVSELSTIVRKRVK